MAAAGALARVCAANCTAHQTSIAMSRPLGIQTEHDVQFSATGKASGAATCVPGAGAAAETAEQRWRPPAGRGTVVRGSAVIALPRANPARPAGTAARPAASAAAPGAAAAAPPAAAVRRQPLAPMTLDSSDDEGLAGQITAAAAVDMPGGRPETFWARHAPPAAARPHVVDWTGLDGTEGPVAAVAGDAALATDEDISDDDLPAPGPESPLMRLPSPSRERAACWDATPAAPRNAPLWAGRQHDGRQQLEAAFAQAMHSDGEGETNIIEAAAPPAPAAAVGTTAVPESPYDQRGASMSQVNPYKTSQGSASLLRRLVTSSDIDKAGKTYGV